MRCKFFLRSIIFSIMFEDMVWPGWTQPMILAKSSCVCLPIFLVCPKYHFRISLNIRRGVAIDIFKTFPGDTDSKYIYIYIYIWVNEIPYLAF